MGKDPFTGLAVIRIFKKTPRAGFEPATNRLTVDRSTAELPRIIIKFSSLMYPMTSAKGHLYLNFDGLCHSDKLPSLISATASA